MAYPYPMLVNVVVAVPPDVISLVYDETLQPEELAGPLGHHGSRQSGPDHHQVVLLLQTIHGPELFPPHAVPVLLHVLLVSGLASPQLLPLPLVRLIEDDLVVVVVWTFTVAWDSGYKESGALQYPHLGLT